MASAHRRVRQWSVRTDLTYAERHCMMVRRRLCRKVRDTMRQATYARPRIQLKKGQVMHTMRTLLGAILLLAATRGYSGPFCTTYTIKENVPRTFIFKIKKNANISKPFRLNASVDSQQ